MNKIKRKMRQTIGNFRTFGKGLCDCGIRFVKHAPNQIHCDECSVWVNETRGRYYGRSGMNGEILQAAADRSGNPKVWTSEEYGQEFLKALIPRM